MGTGPFLFILRQGCQHWGDPGQQLSPSHLQVGSHRLALVSLLGFKDSDITHELQLQDSQKQSSPLFLG